MLHSYSEWYRMCMLKMLLGSKCWQLPPHKACLRQLCVSQTSCLVLGSHTSKEELSCSLPPLTNPPTYQGGLRIYQGGDLSITLCISKEKLSMSPKNRKKAVQWLLASAINLISTKIYTMAWQQIDISVYDEAQWSHLLSMCGLCLRLQEHLRNLLHISECHISTTDVAICIVVWCSASYIPWHLQILNLFNGCF